MINIEQQLLIAAAQASTKVELIRGLKSFIELAEKASPTPWEDANGYWFEITQVCKMIAMKNVMETHKVGCKEIIKHLELVKKGAALLITDPR